MWIKKHLSLATAAYVYLSCADDKTAIQTTKFSGRDVKEMGICRKVLNIHDKTGLNLRVYQYQSCPFSCKVRAFLDYYGFSYEVVEVNPVTKSQLDFTKDYKKVPIVTSGLLVLKDSSLIISKLATYLMRHDLSLLDIEDLYPYFETTRDGKVVKDCPLKYCIMGSSNSEQGLGGVREELEWRQWVDNHFIHLISPNIYRTPMEALETFNWFSKLGNWEEYFTRWNQILAKYLGAFMMYFIAKRLKAKHSIKDEREAMINAFSEWMNAIGPNRRFLGGNEPNLADLAMYGAMTSFSGCSVFRELASNAPITNWYTAVKLAVESHEGRHLVEKRPEYPVPLA